MLLRPNVSTTSTCSPARGGSHTAISASRSSAGSTCSTAPSYNAIPSNASRFTAKSRQACSLLSIAIRLSTCGAMKRENKPAPAYMSSTVRGPTVLTTPTSLSTIFSAMPLFTWKNAPAERWNGTSLTRITMPSSPLKMMTSSPTWCAMLIGISTAISGISASAPCRTTISSPSSFCRTSTRSMPVSASNCRYCQNSRMISSGSKQRSISNTSSLFHFLKPILPLTDGWNWITLR